MSVRKNKWFRDCVKRCENHSSSVRKWYWAHQEHHRQQQQIKAYEDKDPKCDLIVSYLPESEISFAGVSLEDDETKTVAFANVILPPDPALSQWSLFLTAEIQMLFGETLSKFLIFRQISLFIKMHVYGPLYGPI